MRNQFMERGIQKLELEFSFMGLVFRRQRCEFLSFSVEVVLQCDDDDDANDDDSDMKNEARLLRIFNEI